MPSITSARNLSRMKFRVRFDRYFGKTVEEASKREIYTAVSFTIRDQIMEKWVNYKQVADKKPQKELYYLSFEFLMGRALGNNLMNIRETDLYRDALSELNIDLSDIEEQENDAGLGNGGLGQTCCMLPRFADESRAAGVRLWNPL